MLTSYQAQTAQLLQNPAAPVPLYSTAVLTGFINTARGQLSGVEGKCIRAIGTLLLVPGQRVYPFSSIQLGTPALTGIAGTLHINQLFYAVGSGTLWVHPRPWEWFVLFRLNNPTPPSGPPGVWAQYGQGASGQNTGGSIYIDPLPDIPYTLQLDCTCYPQALAADLDIEAIPYLWTDAVPYFAAYLALMSAQTSQRMQEALKYKELYSEFCMRARDAANPTDLNYMYQGAPDLLKATKLGMGGGRAAQ